MTLRARLTLQLAGIFLLLALLLSVLQARLLETLFIDRTSQRMVQSIDTAWLGLEQRRLRLDTTVSLLAGAESLSDPAASPDELQAALHRATIRWDLGLLLLLDESGAVLARGGSSQRGDRPEGLHLDPGAASSGYGVMSSAALARDGEGLARRVAQSGADEGLVAFSAVPVEGVARALVGGLLLNGDDALVDEIEATLFPEGSYRGGKVGTATLFLGRTRVATTVPLEGGGRAVGTRVSDEVAESVLARGEPWTGRARVLDDWYLSRYEPIRDPSGRIVGMLYVGELERIYRDLQRQVLFEGLALVLLAMLLAFLAVWWIGSRLAGQVGALQQATERVASGDLSARAEVQGEDEVAKLAGAFNRMAGQLEADRARIVEQKEAIEAANRNYLEMLSFVSHELRNGLGTALFNIELLREGSFGELRGEQAEGLELVGGSLRYLTDLLDNFLQLSRIEKGELLIKKTPVALARDVVRPALAGFEPQLRDKKMRVEQQIPEGLDVIGDPSLLRIVYENLLSNAWKYGAAGGRIVLRASPREKKVELEVWNEGPGIPEERVPTLFRRFQRYDVGEGRRGTGLGLFIVRQIVRQHGGEVSIDSKPGEGVGFKFDLELSAAPQPLSVRGAGNPGRGNRRRPVPAADGRLEAMREPPARAPKVVRVELRPSAPMGINDRIEAVWDLTLECLAWGPEDQRVPRFRRSVTRVLRPAR